MIETERLILRSWRESDVAPYHAMGQDAEVMRFLGPSPTRGDVASMVERQNAILSAHGYCFWALERKADQTFLGFCGVRPGIAPSPIAGQVEIGWRLARPFWGQGYAREAAEASLAFVWAKTAEPLVAAITVEANQQSRGLMKRLGMVRFRDEHFDHPVFSEGHPLRRHIVYRIDRPSGS